VTDAPGTPAQYAWFGTGAAVRQMGLPPVESIAGGDARDCEEAGSNAIDVATAVINRVEQLKGITIPAGVDG